MPHERCLGHEENKYIIIGTKENFNANSIDTFTIRQRRNFPKTKAKRPNYQEKRKTQNSNLGQKRIL